MPNLNHFRDFTYVVGIDMLSISDFETEKHTLLRHETSGFEARNLRDFET